MDDFDTDFKNPIGIFNPENGSKLDLHLIHKVDHRLSIFVNKQSTPIPRRFPRGIWGPGADHRLGVGGIVFFEGLLKKP
jgi:hypothetical protein